LEVALHVLGFIGIGEGLSEVSLKEIPELFISFQDTHIDSFHKDIQLVFFSCFHCITSHVSESCSDVGEEIGHSIIVTIGCSK
jgi:hypothetical protein